MAANKATHPMPLTRNAQYGNCCSLHDDIVNVFAENESLLSNLTLSKINNGNWKLLLTRRL